MPDKRKIQAFLILLFAFINSASGQSFEHEFLTSGVTEVVSAKAIDLNNDGHDEIVFDAKCYGTWGIGFYLNDGLENFSRPILIHDHLQPLQWSDFDLVDLDQDGDCDIVFYDPVYESIYWISNENDNVFSDAEPIYTFESNDAPTGINQFLFEDLDGDLDIDLTIAGNGIVADLFQQTNFSFELGNHTDYYGLSGWMNTLARVDINNDGIEDYFIAFEDEVLWIDFSTAPPPLNAYHYFLEDELFNESSAYAADFDSDGDPDVAILTGLNAPGESLVFFWNDGNGEFVEDALDQGLTAKGKYLNSIDIDNDGDLDFVYTSEDISLKLLENNGDWSFQTAVTISEQIGGSGSVHYQSVEFPDIDQDGVLDLLLTNNYDAQRIFYREAILGAEHFVGYGADFSLVKIGDIDNDQDPDVYFVTGGLYGGLTTIMENEGETIFSGIRTLGESIYKPTSMEIRDIDEDGLLDWVISGVCSYYYDDDNWQTWNDKIVVYRNQGNLSFQLDMQTGNYGDPLAIGTVDADMDGDLDLLFRNDNKLVYVERLANSWNPNDQWLNFDVFPSLSQLITQDLDNDLDEDILMITQTSSPILRTENQGLGNWAVHDTLNSNISNADLMALGDLNNDGFPDISVVANQEWIYTLINDGNGNFPEEAVIVDGSTSNLDFSDICMGNLNNDGLDDIAACFHFGSYNGLMILLSNSDGTFQLPIEIESGIHLDYDHIEIVDMDLDGKSDLFVSNEVTLSWYRNSLIEGCTDMESLNYDPDAEFNDTSCEYIGCTDPEACNYNESAVVDDGSCVDPPCFTDGDFNEDNEVNIEDLLIWLEFMGCIDPTCEGDFNSDGVVNVFDLLILLSWL